MCFLTLQGYKPYISSALIPSADPQPSNGTVNVNKRQLCIGYHSASAFFSHHEQYIHHGGGHGLARGSLSLTRYS